MTTRHQNISSARIKSASGSFFLALAGLAISLSGISGDAFAAPVSPVQAREEAVEFLNAGGGNIRKSPDSNASAASQHVELAYTSTHDGLTGFYVFNSEHGFVIVSADTRLPGILGYSDHGKFAYDKIPSNMKWWLEMYQSEISNALPKIAESEPNGTTRRKLRAPKREPIAPMVKTTWDQGSPYNMDCPNDASGRKSVTGCVATAMAQLMKYHQWPKQPTGSHGGVVFNGTAYDWANMLDSYADNKYTPTQAQAVATLMRQCGASVDMQYSSYASGAYDYQVPVAFYTYFGYNQGVEMHWRDYTPSNEWASLVYGELAQKRPLYYSGMSKDGGHAFVCDGYDANGYFHFNWGWSGYQDGYYLLSALNPAAGGAGSYEGGYNMGQTILTGLAPSTQINGQKQAAMISTGGFYWFEGSKFGVKDGDNGFNLIYNPLFYNQSIALGVKVESLSDPDFKTKYIKFASTETVQPMYGTSDFSGTISGLPDGKYRVFAAFMSGNDWHDVQIPLGKQNYVALTVANGKNTFSNEGPSSDYTPHLIVGDYITSPQIYGNTRMAFRIPVLNTGDGDYIGQLGVSLFDANDDFGDIASATVDVIIPGNSFYNVDIPFDSDSLQPGVYDLYILDPENMVNYVDAKKVDVYDASLPEIHNGTVLVSDLQPNFHVSGSESPIYFSVENTDISQQLMEFYFQVVDASTFANVKKLPLEYSLRVPANYNGRVNVKALDYELEPGNYLWYIADKNDNPICRATPLIVTSPVMEADGLSYIVTDEAKKLAKVVESQGEPYKGKVVIPASLAGYTPSLRSDAFAFSTVTEISLPECIGNIPAGAFNKASFLKNIFIDAPYVIGMGHEAFAPATIGSTWLNVPQSVANQYHANPFWKYLLQPNWTISAEEGIELVMREINPNTGMPYNPYCMNPFETLTIGISAQSGKNIAVEKTFNGTTLPRDVISPAETPEYTLFALNTCGVGTVNFSFTDDKVGVDTLEAENVAELSGNVYTVDGRLVMRDATPERLHLLSPGLYIISGRKLLIK